MCFRSIMGEFKDIYYQLNLRKQKDLQQASI